MLPESILHQKVLISPLNWGMGHVARSIAIIQQLIEQQNQVFVSCDKSQKAVFEAYFSDLQFIDHQPYPFQFQGKGNWAWDLFNQRKKLRRRFVQERKEVEKYIINFQIDVVLSDHRYGFFSKLKPSVFITHQLHLPLNWFQKAIQLLHQRLLQNFDSVWVLDDEFNSCAGKLSHKIKHNELNYIGIKSRFQLNNNDFIVCDTLYIISGPLPYSQFFLDDCIEMALQKSGNNVCIFPSDLVLPLHLPSNLNCVPSSDWQVVDRYIRGAKFVISRAGYTTIMDLKILNKKSSLIATPGQVEQEYLASILR